MKHIRILHLYSNALDLYGDYKNLTVLQRRIAETGNTSDITEVNLDEVIDPTGYDFVYIGHGKARNLAAVAPHFVQYGDTIHLALRFPVTEIGGGYVSVYNERVSDDWHGFFTL